MSLEHAAHLEVAGGVDNRGARLQEHPFAQAVEVEAGDDGHLLFVVGLALHDGGKDGDLGRGESDRVGFVATLVCPELVVFARHAAEEVIGRDSPIDLVGIGQEKAERGLFVEPELRHVSVVFQPRDDVCTVHHKALRKFARQLLPRADIVVKGQVDRRFLAVHQAVDEVLIAHLRGEAVVAGLGMGEAHATTMEVEVKERSDGIVLLHEAEYRVGGRSRVNMIAVLLAIFGAEVADIQPIVLLKADSCHDSNQENGNADEYAFGLSCHREIGLES